MKQKAIEILIENGADIYAKTFLDETVLELSDDIDVREFIVHKKQELENSQKIIQRNKSLKRNSIGVTRRYFYHKKYFLYSKTCMDWKGPACTSCSSSTTCSACSTGYTIVSGSCV